MVADNEMSGALCAAPQMPCTKREFIDSCFARLKNELVQKSLMEKKIQILQRQLEESEKSLKIMQEQMEILVQTVKCQDEQLKQMECQRAPLVEPSRSQQRSPWWRLAALALCSAPLLLCGLLHAAWSTVELVHNGIPPC